METTHIIFFITHKKTKATHIFFFITHKKTEATHVLK